MCSATHGFSPNGRPIVRDTTHRPMMPALPAAASARRRGATARAAHSAQASCASPETSMNSAAGAYSSM